VRESELPFFVWNLYWLQSAKVYISKEESVLQAYYYQLIHYERLTWKKLSILDIMPTASMQECLQPGDDDGDLLQTKAPTVCILYLQTILDDR
jgi:hypothetical protein